MIPPFDQPEAFVSVFIGTLLGVMIGLIPGVSARAALLIVTPFLLELKPHIAAVFLVTMHAAAQVSGTVPAALFGAPTSSAEAATVINGYPLTLRGQASRVVGVILSSSILGGILGSLILLLVAPFMASAILHIGTPEIAALAFLGILGISAVSSSGLLAGIMLGALGLLCSTVGIDPIHGEVRMTFEIERLIDGFSIPAVIAGIIAVPELLRREQDGMRSSIQRSLNVTLAWLYEPFRHIFLVLKSAVIGVIVGIIPGIGTSVAVWLSYGLATRSKPKELQFGEGAIEGVIAPEVAAGSKEGGAFIPTLFFGIPGSSGMAIILAAFSVIGIQVGPAMFRSDPTLPSVVAISIIFANLLGLALCLIFAPLLIRMASFPRKSVAILSICGALTATYFTAPVASTSLQIVGFGLFGLLLIRVGIARAPFLLGFIIGPVLESTLQRSSLLFGLSSFLRPGVLFLVSIAAIIILSSVYKNSSATVVNREARGQMSYHALLPLLICGAVALLGLHQSQQYPAMPAMMMWFSSILTLTALVMLLVQKFRLIKPSRHVEPIETVVALFTFLGLILSIWIGWIALLLPVLILLTDVLGQKLKEVKK